MAAGCCLATALALTRFLSFQVWITPADFHQSAAAIVLCALLDALLCSLSVAVIFRASRRRLAGVLLLSVAVLVDFQTNLFTASVVYTGNAAGALQTLPVSSSVLATLLGALVAALALLLIGLQFHRMKLSRYALSSHISKLQESLRQEKQSRQEQQLSVRRLRLEADVMAKMMQMINLCRPVKDEHSVALAFAATAEILCTATRSVGQSSHARTGSSSLQLDGSSVGAGGHRPQQADSPERAGVGPQLARWGPTPSVHTHS